ncbi:hypothetical protein B484DRAFT_442957 [Ochromonadaceae sp. CCMP2298]|nr:hypothetical protein B484DRAFT_442957 [Ochromonadaceae sp. CCMP2298]
MSAKGEDDRAESKAGEGKVDDDSKDTADAKDTATSSKLSPDELLEKVQMYFYCNEELASFFESFINERSSVVDLSSEEYKLEYTKVFNEYKDVFESKMEDYILSLNSSIHDFYFALKSKTDAGEETSESVFALILVAVTDFDVFMTMMRESAQSNASSADHK